MKYVKWVLKSIIIAILLLFAVNVCGRYININIPINVYTVFIVGIFKIPGIIVLIIFYLL